MYSGRTELTKAVVIVGEDTIEGIYDSSCGIISYAKKNDEVLSSVHNIEIGHFDAKSSEVVISGPEGIELYVIELSREKHFKLEDMFPNWDDIFELGIQYFYHTADACVRHGLRFPDVSEEGNSDIQLARRMRAIGDFFNEQLTPDIAARLG